MLNIFPIIINTMNQPEIIATVKLVSDIEFFVSGNYKRNNCSNIGITYNL